jgi:hypothetical protein
MTFQDNEISNNTKIEETGNFTGIPVENERIFLLVTGHP